MSKSNDDLEARVKWLTHSLDSSGKRIRTLIEALPVCLFLLNERGAVQAANAQTLATFGGSYDDFRDHHIIEFFHKRHEFLADDAVFAGNEGAREVVAKRISGELFPASVRVRTIGEAPEILRAVFVEDVSAKHEIERMKQDFIAMVSHDLRSPLTSVMMTIEMLSTGFYGDLNEQGAGSVQRAEESLSRLINLVNDLLDLDKMESGQLELSFDDVSVRALADDGLLAVSELMRIKNLSARIDIDDNRMAYCDRDRMVQALVNIISNAIKFSSEGQSITLRADVDQGMVRLAVIDQGRGIPADKLATVFERFHQVNRDDGRRGIGSGLGLSICKSIVEQHRGNVSVVSEVGKGSTFCIAIPASQSQYNLLQKN